MTYAEFRRPPSLVVPELIVVSDISSGDVTVAVGAYQCHLFELRSFRCRQHLLPREFRWSFQRGDGAEVPCPLQIRFAPRRPRRRSTLRDRLWRNRLRVTRPA